MASAEVQNSPCSSRDTEGHGCLSTSIIALMEEASSAGSLWCHSIRSAPPHHCFPPRLKDNQELELRLCRLQFYSILERGVGVVSMTRINIAEGLYFHYSFAATDFPFCIIMNLKVRPSLHDNDWENHSLILLIVNPVVFFCLFLL